MVPQETSMRVRCSDHWTFLTTAIIRLRYDVHPFDAGPYTAGHVVMAAKVRAVIFFRPVADALKITILWVETLFGNLAIPFFPVAHVAFRVPVRLPVITTQLMECFRRRL